MPRSARRRSRAGQPRAWQAPPSSSVCRVRRVPAAMAGTGFLRPSSIIARGPATSSRSCLGWTNICAGRRQKEHRSRPSRLIDKFQYNGLTEPYEVTAKLGKPRYCRGYQPVIFMTVVEPRVKVKRETRRQLHKRLAWITVDDGVSERECHVLDVSSGGARIASDDAMDVRDC